MKAIFAVLAVVGLCLSVIAVSLFRLHDATTLTSPPEAVVENFMHELATHRYSQALKYLDEELRGRTDIDSLERLVADLELRVGKIKDVRGEPLTIANDDAQVQAVMKTPRTKFYTARFALSRRSGIWLIAEMHF